MIKKLRREIILIEAAAFLLVRAAYALLEASDALVVAVA